MTGAPTWPPSSPLPLLLTPGDPAGIGAEIALLARAAWTRAEGEEAVPPFALLDDPARLARLAETRPDLPPIVPIDSPAQTAAAFAEGLPVLEHRFPAPVTPGHPDPANGGAVIDAIARAVGWVRDGAAAAVVTNPIAKHIVQAAGFAHAGHTEYLAALAAAPEETPPTPVMMLAGPGLRVVPVTVHIPLREVPEQLRTAAIAEAGEITARALVRDFGIAAPRLAVAGLNPHAGENGTLGREDIEIVAPAVARLRAAGHAVSGPLSADTMFHPAARARYDAALCMYHDQALIPLKTLAFDEGVNITLGLPFVRTSPDHGTAFDLAGTWRASPRSLIAALATARTMAANRQTAAANAGPDQP